MHWITHLKSNNKVVPLQPGVTTLNPESSPLQNRNKAIYIKHFLKPTMRKARALNYPFKKQQYGCSIATWSHGFKS